jgi:hypothetical protein
MLVRKSPLDLRIVLVHELRKHFPSCSASVLSEAGPDRVALQQPYEPGVQAIVVQLLHQLSFLPNALERCTAITPEDRGPSFVRMELTKATVQLDQHIADERPNLSQRICSATPTFRREARKQPALIHKCACIRASSNRIINVNQQIFATARAFRQIAGKCWTRCTLSTLSAEMPPRAATFTVHRLARQQGAWLRAYRVSNDKRPGSAFPMGICSMPTFDFRDAGT